MQITKTNERVEAKLKAQAKAQYLTAVVRYNIKRICNSENRGQGTLSDFLDSNPASVSQMLNGGKILRFQDIVIVAEDLGVTISDLMDDTAMRKEMEDKRKEAELMLQLSQEMKKAPTGDRSRLSEGAPAGIRTLDTLIKSQLL